jgi:protein-S-isoprenylcysteine O-methyltransferase Ste14
LIYFYVCLAICFVCYAVRTLFNTARYRKVRAAEKKAVVVSIYVTMGLLWFSWFQMCFSDPVRIDLPAWVRYSGLTLFAAGVFLFLVSHTRLGGFKNERGLVTGGIYSKVRNPMYLGFAIWIIGLPLFTKSIVTLASSPVWIAHIVVWKILEEKVLLRGHEEYADYMRRTWF